MFSRWERHFCLELLVTCVRFKGKVLDQVKDSLAEEVCGSCSRHQWFPVQHISTPG
jgi:hypothetical protein